MISGLPGSAVTRETLGGPKDLYESDGEEDYKEWLGYDPDEVEDDRDESFLIGHDTDADNGGFANSES